jgi:hypothetical protein
MYSVIGIQRILSVYGVAAILIVGGILYVEWTHLLSVLTTGDPLHVVEMFWAAVAKALMIASVLLWLLGETPLFAALFQNRLFRRVIPDLDGEWVGTVESNWHLVSRRSSVAHFLPDSGMGQPTTSTNVRVTIKARLLSVTMTLETDILYSTSETLLVGVTKRPGSGVVEVRYIYQNRTLIPKPSDSSNHFGAAILDLEQRKNEMVLIGPYWTNRNWQNGLNTAGTVTLRRAA